jgi:aspartyl-tRNA(Asn)/glutamyl-tRNA(Gln) amidotransferase subunit C
MHFMASKIDINTVEQIAHLARLEFNADAKAEILNDLNRIIGFVDKLSELDTSEEAPLIYMTDEKNVLRQDLPEQLITQKEALKNAPKKDSDYFKVPKVIDQQA